MSCLMSAMQSSMFKMRSHTCAQDQRLVYGPHCKAVRLWMKGHHPTDTNGAPLFICAAPSMEKTSTAKFLGAFATCRFTFLIEMFSGGTPS